MRQLVAETHGCVTYRGGLMVKRFELLKIFAAMISDDTLVVTPTGNTSKFWDRLGKGEKSLSDVTLGMCTPTALGLSLALPHRRVVALDSDGNLLLNLASLGTVANENPANLLIIVFDNANYNSGGPGRGKAGMPTATAGKLNLEAVARGCGLKNAATVSDADAFREAVSKGLKEEGPSFIVARVDPVDDPAEGAQSRIKERSFDRRQNKYMFAMRIEQMENIQILKPKIG